MIQAPPKSNTKTGFCIGVTCPGCGAGLELESDFFVLNCHYCGSVLRIDMPDIPPAYLIKSELPQREIRFHIDRYLKKERLPLTTSMLETRALYYPYWKIDAIVLKVRNTVYEKTIYSEYDSDQETKTEQQMTDIRLTPFTATMAAGPIHPNIPHSIGMRTEYIKLWTFSEENIDQSFEVVPVKKRWDEAEADISKTMLALDKISKADFGKNMTEYFHPHGAIVYFPYYIVRSDYKDKMREFIIDGVSGRVLKYDEKSLIDTSSLTVGQSPFEFGKLNIELHRCGTCGWDLPGEQSAVYICKNCHELTVMKNSDQAVKTIYTVNGRFDPNDQFFPFWSFKISGADAARLKPMFGGMFQSDRLVVPGFKLPNFESMYRLSKRISSASPKFDLYPLEMMGSGYRNVTMPLSEALVMADVIIYRAEIGLGVRSKPGNLSFSPLETSLFYLPFHQQNYFYVDSLFDAVTFEKSLL